MKAYKGFDKDLRCRGFQYEIGKEYEEDGAKACEKGFHACEVPLDVFSYYPPAGSRYCEVEQEGEISKGGDDSKVASSKIKIGAEIGIAGLVKAQIEWVRERATQENSEHATGTRGAASATGKDSIAVASGFEGKVMGALGGAIVCCERGEWNGETYPLLCVKAAIVDGVTLKANTWYTVKGGEWVEANG